MSFLSTRVVAHSTSVVFYTAFIFHQCEIRMANYVFWSNKGNMVVAWLLQNFIWAITRSLYLLTVGCLSYAHPASHSLKTDAVLYKVVS